MELTSLALGAVAAATVGGPAVDGPQASVQQADSAFVATCKLAMPYEVAAKALGQVTPSAGFILDPTIAEPSCQA